MASVQDALKARFSKLKDDALNMLGGLSQGATGVSKFNQRLSNSAGTAFKETFVPTSREFQQSNRQFAQLAKQAPENSVRGYVAQGLEGLRSMPGMGLIFRDEVANAPQTVGGKVARLTGASLPAFTTAGILGGGSIAGSMLRATPGIAAQGTIGAGVSKLFGGDPFEGATKGISAYAPIRMVSGITNPLITNTAGRLGQNIVNPVARGAVSRGVAGLLSIPEGMIMNRSLGIKNYTPTDALLDVGIGAFTGGANRPRVEGIDGNVYALKNENIREHIKTLEQKIKSLSENGGNKTAIKQYQKAIDNAYREIVKNRQMASKLGLKAGIVGTTKNIDPLASLKNEARKYGSAEEFVKAQGTPVYHGTDKVFDSFDVSKSGTSFNQSEGGLFFVKEKDTANAFSSLLKGDNKRVIEGYVKTKNPKIVDLKDGVFYPIENNKIIAEAKARGHDVVIFKNVKGGEGYKTDYTVVLDNNAVKTKSQLTDIWNKANVTQPLAEEARKYKSAEEFVSSRLGVKDLGDKEGADVMLGRDYEFDFGNGKVVNGAIRETPTEIYLNTIGAKNKLKNWETLKGEGIGTKVVDTLKEYADLTGKKLIVPDAINSALPYWEKRPFLKRDYSVKVLDETGRNYYPRNTFSYTPNTSTSQLTDIYNQAKGVTGQITEMARTLKNTSDQNLNKGLALQDEIERLGGLKEWATAPDGMLMDKALAIKNQAKKNLNQAKGVEQPQVLEQEQLSPRIEKVAGQQNQPRSNVLTDTQRILPEPKELAQDFQITKENPQKLRQLVTKENPQKLGQLEEKVFGSATPQSSAIEQGNKTGAGMISDSLRKLEAKVSEYAGKGLESQRNSVRNISRLLQGFAGGLGKPRDLIARVGKFRGGVDYSTELAIETQKHGAGLVGNDIKKLERIHAVMDPDLAITKVKKSDLLPDEKEALDFFKTVSDYINDTNFKNGFISRELWEKNKGGKYIARAYEAFDFPPEVADIVKQAKGKFDLNPFVKRKDVDQWKLDEAIRDPAYLLSKRLQQTVMNDETHKMFAYLKGTNFASDTPKPGFIQLSKSKAFGKLSGKYVRKDVLDDIRGLFFANETANKAYDVLKAYDRNPLRQIQKRLLTIFNPAVAFGNKASNFVYAHLSGINPVTFEKNKLWAGNEIKTKGQMYRRMMQDGLIGTDAMKAELANFTAKLQKEYKDPNVVRKILDSIQGDYGKSDDVAKISAMKTFLDRGYSYEESARRVYDGFQNYRTVGWLYDIGSKLPIFGNPFVRFAGDLTRITKNQTINHPARVIGTVIMWKIFTDVMSSASGETPEDRATREGRIGASRLPLTNVSLEVQTPWGAVDASRLLGGLYANNPTGENSALSDIKRLSPIQVPDIAGATQSGNYRRALTGLTTSPDIGPAMGLLLDTDFRGKSIADPNQNKYTGSLLTPTEQNMNRLRYAVNAYVPYARDIDNIASAVKGEANMYGQIRNTPQAVLRTFPGIKVVQYGPEQADLQRLKDAGYQQASNDYYDKQITAVKKQETAGTITPEEAKKKIEYITSQKKNVYGNGYVKSKDAPSGLLPTIGTYTKSLVTDPGQTIQAVLAGNPIRKVEGDTVILERKKGLSGDTDPRTERDHKIALTLGGDNSDSNLQYLTKAENRAKGVVDTYLYKLMKEGKITRKEAQKRNLNWKDEIQNLPKATQRKLVLSLSEIGTTEETSTDTKTAKVTGKGVFILKNPETGSETVIDLSQPITKPTPTGLKELDTKARSSYYSKIGTRITQIYKLYEDKQLTAEEANKLISILKSQQARVKTKKASGGKKKASQKLKIKAIKAPNFQQLKPVQLGNIAPKVQQPKINIQPFKVQSKPLALRLDPRIRAGM